MSERVPDRIRQELEQFFLAATVLEGKDPRTLGWDGAKQALALITQNADKPPRMESTPPTTPALDNPKARILQASIWKGVANGEVREVGGQAGRVRHAPQEEGHVEEWLRTERHGKQAIAIGLSEAREKGAKVPKRKTGGRKRSSSKRN